MNHTLGPEHDNGQLPAQHHCTKRRHKISDTALPPHGAALFKPQTDTPTLCRPAQNPQPAQTEGVRESELNTAADAARALPGAIHLALAEVDAASIERARFGSRRLILETARGTFLFTFKRRDMPVGAVAAVLRAALGDRLKLNVAD